MITSKLSNRSPNAKLARHPADHEFTKGEDHRSAKLTESDVRAIHQRYANGESESNLATEFSVTALAIRRIVRGIQWRHLNLPNIYRKPQMGLPLEVCNTIRQKYLDDPNVKYADLAKEFDRSVTVIRRIITGESPKRHCLANIVNR